MIKPFAVLLLTFALLTTLAQPSAARSFVYVSNYGDGTISQFRANPNGTLTPLHPAMVRAHLRCHSLAVARGRFLYVSSALRWSKRNCLVSQFRIRPNGTLTPLSPPQILVPGTPSLVAAEPSGKFVYVFSQEGGVAQYRVGTGGQLSPLAPMIVKVAEVGGITPIVGFDKAHQILYGSFIGGSMDISFGGTFAFAIRRQGQLRLLPRRGTFLRCKPNARPIQSNRADAGGTAASSNGTAASNADSATN